MEIELNKAAQGFPVSSLDQGETFTFNSEAYMVTNKKIEEFPFENVHAVSLEDGRLVHFDSITKVVWIRNGKFTGVV